MVYLPPAFTESRTEVPVEHVERFDFGLLLSHGAAGLMANHIPFLIERDGETLHLQGHLARLPRKRGKVREGARRGTG